MTINLHCGFTIAATLFLRSMCLFAVVVVVVGSLRSATNCYSLHHCRNNRIILGKLLVLLDMFFSNATVMDLLAVRNVYRFKQFFILLIFYFCRSWV